MDACTSSNEQIALFWRVCEFGLGFTFTWIVFVFGARMRRVVTAQWRNAMGVCDKDKMVLCAALAMYTLIGAAAVVGIICWISVHHGF